MSGDFFTRIDWTMEDQCPPNPSDCVHQNRWRSATLPPGVAGEAISIPSEDENIVFPAWPQRGSLGEPEIDLLEGDIFPYHCVGEFTNPRAARQGRKIPLVEPREFIGAVTSVPMVMPGVGQCYEREREPCFVPTPSGVTFADIPVLYHARNPVHLPWRRLFGEQYRYEAMLIRQESGEIEEVEGEDWESQVPRSWFDKIKVHKSKIRESNITKQIVSQGILSNRGRSLRRRHRFERTVQDQQAGVVDEFDEGVYLLNVEQQRHSQAGASIVSLPHLLGNHYEEQEVEGTANLFGDEHELPEDDEDDAPPLDLLQGVNIPINTSRRKNRRKKGSRSKKMDKTTSQTLRPWWKTLLCKWK
jgi:hypothetical protein